MLSPSVLKPLPRGQLDKINSNLFSREMLKVFFVFQTHVFQQVGIGLQRLSQLDRPWLGVRLGVINGDLDLQTAEVRAAKPLGDLGCVSHRGARTEVEPRPVAQPVCLNYQSVPI